ncbi:hypothetical protein GQ54DRAFT_284647 [Martensiomyces pterosporus]|nr:hypothetical protein GQ54DRAFT_284647 [Martensiomyces pterosporus]
MSSYAPIDDEPSAAAGAHKEEHGSASQGYPSQSHPYSSGYGSPTSPYQQTESQVIQVTPPPSSSYASNPGAYGYSEPTAGPSTFSSQEGGQRISRYETSLSLRYDVEAALAYALGVFSGAFLLVFERKNDYVRFHAWQSSLLSGVMFFSLLIAALVSNFLYWVVLLAAAACSVYMARRAYVDGAVFERFTLPYVGPLACQFVDEE